MEATLIYTLAKSIQEKMDWDQSERKLDEIVQFVSENYDLSLSTEDNVNRIINLYQQQGVSERIKTEK